MRVTDRELRAVIEPRTGPVARLVRRPSPSASTAGLELLEVRWADGAERTLVLKSAGRDTAREVAVYEQVLRGAGLGTAGFVAGSTRGAGWLLLEAVPGRPLWESADLGAWCVTARWLARAHVRLAGAAHRLGQAVADGGLDKAVARDPRATRLEDPYALAVAALRAAPATVVHGELFPSNVLVRERAGPCVVDWETAGSGSGLLDLAALCTGWPPDEAQEIARAYGGDLALLPAARLVVAVRWLAEPAPDPQAAGGQAARTDWFGEATAAAQAMAAQAAAAQAAAAQAVRA